MPLVPQHKSLIFSEALTVERLSYGDDEFAWSVAHLGDNLDVSTGLWGSLGSYLSENNITCVQWLKSLESVDYKLDVVLSVEEWQVVYATYLHHVLMGESPMRILKNTYAWIYNFVQYFSRKGQLTESQKKGYEFFSPNISDEELNTLINTVAKNPHNKSFVALNKTFELRLADWLIGKEDKDKVLTKEIHDIYLTEIRTLLVGLDFILTFKKKQKLLTDAQWAMVKDILENHDNVNKYYMHDLLKLRALNAREFDLGDEPNEFFAPDSDVIKGFVQHLSRSNEMRMYLLGADKYVTTINSYVLADLIKHKDNVKFIDLHYC